MTISTTSAQRGDWVELGLPKSDHQFVHASGDKFSSLDPTTTEVVATLSSTTLAEVDSVVSAAGDAFQRSSWRSDGSCRAQVLYRFSIALREHSESLAELLTREQGKTVQEARIEINGAADMVEYYAGLARAVYGRSAILGEDVQGVILREPVGVIAIITPWNWPLTLLVRSLAPALAAGNACIVKPSSLTSAVTIEALALLAADGGLPKGIMSCVLGSGSIVGDKLVGHIGVDMIAFTGASDTGVGVMKRAADGLKKVALELGGKSPNIIFADANLDKALAGTLNAIFTSCGQICTAGSRLLVEDKVYDKFIGRLIDATVAMVLGDPLDESSSLGPLVSPEQKRTVMDYVNLGLSEGTLLCGGNAPHGLGSFVEPTIFADLPPDSRLLREEIFGPVLTVQRFSSDEEALSLADTGDFGLAAGIWTSDLNRAWRIGRALNSGTIWINTYHHFYPEAEVGGFRKSGIGRQQGLGGLEEFTETKHLNFDGKNTLW